MNSEKDAQGFPSQEQADSSIDSRRRSFSKADKLLFKLSALALLASLTVAKVEPSHAQSPEKSPHKLPEGPTQIVPPSATTQQPLESMLAKQLTSNSRSSHTEAVPKAETNKPLDYVWAPTAVTPEQFRANPQYIGAIADLKNTNGEVIRQFILKKNGIIYDTYPDQNGQMVEYAPISDTKVPISNLTALEVYEDGLMLAGGEDGFGSGITSFALSQDRGKTWQKLDDKWAFGVRGVPYTIHKLPTADNSKQLLLNLEYYERSKASIYLAKIDENGIQFQETNIKGRLGDISALSLGQSPANEYVWVSSGRQADAPGIVIGRLNLTTGVGTEENYLKNLDVLFGGVQFNYNGIPYYAVNKDDSRSIYIINLSDLRNPKVEKTINYSNMMGTSTILTLAFFKTDDSRKLVFGGSRPDRRPERDGWPIPVTGNFTLDLTLNPIGNNLIDVDTEITSGIGSQKQTEVKRTPNSVPFVEMVAVDWGKIIYDPQTNTIIRSKKGMDNTAVRLWTPQIRRLYAPVIIK